MENYIEYLYQKTNETLGDFRDRVNDFIRYKNIISTQFINNVDSYYWSCFVTWKKEIN